MKPGIVNTSSPPNWGDRCLAVTRFCAIFGAVTAPVSTALTSVACAIMLISWSVSGRVATTLRDALSLPVGKALALFLGVLLIGLLYSPVPWGEKLDSLWGWRKLVYALPLLGVFVAGASDRRLMVAFLGMTVTGMAISFLVWFGLVPFKVGHDGVVLQNHPVQGITFSVAILFALILGMSASIRWRWILVVVSCGLVANILFVTSGRSGHLALLIVFAITLGVVVGWRRVYLWVPAAMAIAVIAFSASPLWREKLAQGVAEMRIHDQVTEVTSIGTRILYYQTAWELIKDRPVFGYGTGSYGHHYTAIVSERYKDWRGEPGSDPHNQYLYVWAENGAIGVVVFLGFLFAAFRRALQSPHGLAAAGVLLIWCVTSLFNSHFRTFPEGHMIGLMLGVLLASGRVYPPRPTQMSNAAKSSEASGRGPT